MIAAERNSNSVKSETIPNDRGITGATDITPTTRSMMEFPAKDPRGGASITPVLLIALFIDSPKGQSSDLPSDNSAKQ